MMQTANVRQRIKEKVNILKKYLDENRKIPFNGMDIKVLKGQWYPYKRLSVGKIRIIFDVDFKLNTLFIEEIDNRGDIY